MFVAMNDGKVKGMLCVGQNPATSLNAKLERAALRKLEWLVVKDNWLHETATFWKTAPEVVSGEVKPEDIQTEVFFFPSAQVAETEGTLHQHAADDAVALQGGRAAGRLPHRSLVHLPARQAAEEAVRRQSGRRATRDSGTWSSTTSTTMPQERAASASPTRARS